MPTKEILFWQSAVAGGPFKFELHI